MKKRLLMTVAVVLLLLGCGTRVSDPSGDPILDTKEQTDAFAQMSEPLATQLEEDEIESLLRQMTLREKVGQMFIVPADSLQPNDAASAGVTVMSETMADMLREYPVGGIALFGGNIVDSAQLISFVDSLQGVSSVPLFIAIDEEGGAVARLANHPAFHLPKYASAAAVGRSEDGNDALAMGTAIGAYLAHYGINMDFAPVADVNTNPNNPVIGNRAFSSKAPVAAVMARSMADGLKQQGIIPVFKHFPGHGDTGEDSHYGVAVTYKSKEEMAACEWLPYKSLTNEDCVMVGHIAAPNISGDNTPATMSYEMINGILRTELGFDGVVMTDSMMMGAITNAYGPGDAAIAAVKAGCDIILAPDDLGEAFDALINAVENGEISEERVNESVYRILRLKKEYGILN